MRFPDSLINFCTKDSESEIVLLNLRGPFVFMERRIHMINDVLWTHLDVGWMFFIHLLNLKRVVIGQRSNMQIVLQSVFLKSPSFSI